MQHVGDSTHKAEALILTRYGHLGASSRIRLLQYVPNFGSFMDVKVQCLFPNSYVKSIGSRSKIRRNVLASIGSIQRSLFLFLHLVLRKTYDVVIVEQELIPNLATRIEVFVLRSLTRQAIVIDIDDGNHLRYQCPKGFLGRFCVRKFEQIWHCAALVVCGSQQLVSDVVGSGISKERVVLIPSVPPTNSEGLSREGVDQKPLIVGWIGSPSTAADLELVWEALKQAADEFEIALHIVGAVVAPLEGLVVICKPWSPYTEQELLAKADVGIMPLFDTDFRRRKCGFKLIQYMSVGIPVIASDVGGNSWIVESGGRSAGLLVRSSREWLEAFRIMLGCENERRNRGRDGLVIANERFSPTVIEREWSQLLRRLSSDK